MGRLRPITILEEMPMAGRIASILPVALLTVVILATTVPCCLADGQPVPRMVMDDTTFDFRDVDEGTVLEHDFIVKNVGKQNLQIKKVVPG